MSAGEQTPIKRRRNQMIPPPTSKRRLPNAGGQPASGTQSRFRWCREARLALFHTVTATINRDNLSMVKQHIEQCSLRSPELAARVEEDNSHNRRAFTYTLSPGFNVSVCLASISLRLPFSIRMMEMRELDPFSVRPPASEMAVKTVMSSS